MDLNLAQHTALIVGGASGIGLATARTFAQEGANVVLWDLQESVVSTATELARDFQVEGLGLVVDITNEADVAQALDQTLQAANPIQHLVHAAAIGSGKFGFPFTQLNASDWKTILEVNVMGMVHVAHALTPHMVDSGGESMVFLSSVAGQIGSQTDPPYSASKAANINFAQCIAKDLAKHRIRVNVVCPGMVKTPLNRSVWQSWYDQAETSERLDYEVWAERKIRDLVPLGEWQTPEAIANMIVFLSSNRAHHVTGQTINVDGGFVMHW